MDNEQRRAVRIIDETERRTQLDLFPENRAVMGVCEVVAGGIRQAEIDGDAFCQGCEFVKLLNPDGLGYCQVHGDIDGRENNPRDHTGENL